MKLALRSVLVVMLSSSGLVGGACTSTAIPPPEDDAGAKPDLFMFGRCEQVPPALTALLKANTKCTVDADCVFGLTSCGLPNNCGAFYNKAAAAPLATYVAQWNGLHCGDGLHCAPCQSPMEPAGCENGACAAKITCATIAAAVQALIDTQTACTKDSDCVVPLSACGLPGECGAYVNVNAATPLDTLNKQFTGLGCPNNGCPPCARKTPAICKNKVCQAS